MGQKSPWRERKELYLAHLRAAEGEGVLVSACDKLANLQAILLDLTEIGESVWKRFTGGKDGSLWYYAELVEALADGCRRRWKLHCGAIWRRCWSLPKRRVFGASGGSGSR